MEDDEAYSLLAKIKQELAEENIDELKKIILNADCRQHFVAIGWDLVPELSAFLTDQVKCRKPNLLYACEDLLICVATYGNAKELLLAYLEQLDQFKEDVKFKTLLQPLQICLARLPAKRQHSFDITLETVYAHLLALPKPEYHELEGDEKALLETDPDVVRISEVVSAALDFISPFVEEVETCRRGLVDETELDSKVTSQRLQIARFLLRIIDHPLRYTSLELREGSSIKSNLRIVSETLMVFLAKLFGDFQVMIMEIISSNHKIVENHLESDNQEEKVFAEEKISDVALGCFLYLLHHEFICINSFAYVISSWSRLETSLIYITALLSDDHAYVTAKGVLLAQTLIGNIVDGVLPESVLDMPKCSSFIRAMIQVMTYCPSKEVRQNAVKILPNLISKFCTSGRAKLLIFVLSVATHAGVLGFAINLLKEEINRSLNSSPEDRIPNKTIKFFFQLVFRLQDGAATDLLDRSDRIMAALNLLRFLVIRDRSSEDHTGIWSILPTVERNFLEPLRTGLDMSRAHYQLELKGIQIKKNDDQGLEMSLSVGGQTMPSVDSKQRVKMLQLALHTFDMMDSVLGRVNELITCNKKSI